jgi:hypothetical protein
MRSLCASNADATTSRQTCNERENTMGTERGQLLYVTPLKTGEPKSMVSERINCMIGFPLALYRNGSPSWSGFSVMCVGLAVHVGLETVARNLESVSLPKEHGGFGAPLMVRDV